MKARLRFCFLGVVSLVLGAAALAGESGRTGDAPKPNTPEVWLVHQNLEHLVRDGASWDFVKEHLDGVGIYIGQLRKTDSETLRKLMRTLKENNIQIAIECGGPQAYTAVDRTNGRASAAMEMDALNMVARAGGRVDFLNMDGPVSRLLKTGRHRFEFKELKREGFDEIEPCADQLVEYMKAVREKYPHTKFNDISNFGNWGYDGGISYHARFENRQDWGDYHKVLQAIIAKTRAAGIPLSGVTVDTPYDYLIGAVESSTLRHPEHMNWLRRLRDLEDYVKSQGLEFNLMINSERGGMKSDQLFYEETLKYLDLYRSAGGSPKRYLVQSWEKHPAVVVPETEPYSMTALVKEVIKRVKQGKAGT